jgi:hypothetical protein
MPLLIPLLLLLPLLALVASSVTEDHRSLIIDSCRRLLIFPSIHYPCDWCFSTHEPRRPHLVPEVLQTEHVLRRRPAAYSNPADLIVFFIFF